MEGLTSLIAKRSTLFSCIQLKRITEFTYIKQRENTVILHVPFKIVN